MKNERYPNNGYVHGTRKRGRQNKRWVDMIREDCEELHMTLPEAICMTQDRKLWRATIADACNGIAWVIKEKEKRRVAQAYCLKIFTGSRAQQLTTGLTYNFPNEEIFNRLNRPE